MSAAPDLLRIKGYYQARVSDLKCFAQYGTPWEFIGGAMLIEWIANLTEPDSVSFPEPSLQRPHFVDMVRLHLPDYASFEFQNEIASLDDPSVTTKQYLPLQIYLSFRNPLVHAFSMLPENRQPDYVPPSNPTSYKQLDRPGCIVICHRSPTSKRWDGDHLALVEGDRCQLRSPDYLEDLEELIESVFQAAETDSVIADRISSRFNNRRPVDVIGELEILRSGPSRPEV
ncbi:hypothetical protein KBF38_23730 [bacterium]|nr:hypothetical protein [bacterium]